MAGVSNSAFAVEVNELLAEALYDEAHEHCGEEHGCHGTPIAHYESVAKVVLMPIIAEAQNRAIAAELRRLAEGEHPVARVAAVWLQQRADELDPPSGRQGYAAERWA